MSLTRQDSWSCCPSHWHECGSALVLCVHPVIVPKIQKVEKETTACLGFPSAHIHVDSNCLEISIPLCLERVHLTSGTRERGGRAGVFKGMTEEDGSPVSTWKGILLCHDAVMYQNSLMAAVVCGTLSSFVSVGAISFAIRVWALHSQPKNKWRRIPRLT